jgi:hypothetical protein
MNTLKVLLILITTNALRESICSIRVTNTSHNIQHRAYLLNTNVMQQNTLLCFANPNI